MCQVLEYLAIRVVCGGHAAFVMWRLYRPQLPSQRELAVLVPNLLEIRDLSTQIDTRTFREPGVIGSVVASDAWGARVMGPPSPAGETETS